MKKFNSILAAAAMFIMSAISANAQMINNVNLESVAKQQYGTSWTKAAEADLANYTLDDNDNMVFTKVINAPELSQDELYIEMANWFICNYDNSLQFADKEQGVIIARPFIQNIATSEGGFNAYDISICPTVRAQVMDGKVMVTYTLHDYNVLEKRGGGNVSSAITIGLAAAAVTGAVLDATSSHHTTYVDHHYYGHHSSTTIYHEYRPRHTFEDALLLSCIANSATYGPSKDSKTWPIAACYPYTAKDKHKKASSKAFIMAGIYSQVVMENIQTAINQCSVAYACNK